MIHFKLTYLFSEPNIEAFLQLTKWRDEEFLAEIAKINQITEQRLNQRIMIHEGEVLIPSLIQRKWPEILFDVQKNTLFFSEEERRSMIYLLTFSAYDFEGSKGDQRGTCSFQDSTIVLSKIWLLSRGRGISDSRSCLSKGQHVIQYEKRELALI